MVNWQLFKSISSHFLMQKNGDGGSKLDTEFNERASLLVLQSSILLAGMIKLFTFLSVKESNYELPVRQWGDPSGCRSAVRKVDEQQNCLFLWCGWICQPSPKRLRMEQIHEHKGLKVLLTVKRIHEKKNPASHWCPHQQPWATANINDFGTVYHMGLG